MTIQPERRTSNPRRGPVLAALALGAGLLPVSALAAEEANYSSQQHDFRVVTLAEGLSHPWGLSFLPDGAALITERGGALKLFRDGRLDPVEGAPAVVARGQGGLLDVAVHPDFAENGWIYMTLAGSSDAGVSTHLARGKLEGTTLTGVEVLFRSQAVTSTTRHFGSRLQFHGEGHLFMTVGDRGERETAQTLASHAGSVLRLTEEGAPAEGNPFAGQAGALPEIWSMGHRNPQGLTRRAEDGTIWAVEHGPRGGDELNLIEPGRNYGWPVITYGKEYSGLRVGAGIAEKDGLAQPRRYWVPSISPSGLAFYSGEVFPEWRGDLFLGALSGQALVRLWLDGSEVIGEERLLEDLGARIRDVRQGPDGLLYLLTDEGNGRLLRLEPAG